MVAAIDQHPWQRRIVELDGPAALASPHEQVGRDRFGLLADELAPRLGVIGAKLAHHVGQILLVDPATTRPLPLDYDGLTGLRRDDGRISGVELRLPAGTELPPRLRAYAIADVFPLGTRTLRP